MNLKGSEVGYKETTEIKDYKSPINREIEETGRQTYRELLKSMVLVMTKTFNIIYLETFLILLKFQLKTRILHQNLHPNMTKWYCN